MDGMPTSHIELLIAEKNSKNIPVLQTKHKQKQTAWFSPRLPANKLTSNGVQNCTIMQTEQMVNEDI